MTITIEFETDNAAFEEDMRGEVHDILTFVTERVVKHIERTEPDITTESGRLSDVNGNIIGRWQVVP